MSYRGGVRHLFHRILLSIRHWQRNERRPVTSRRNAIRGLERSRESLLASVTGSPRDSRDRQLAGDQIDGGSMQTQPAHRVGSCLAPPRAVRPVEEISAI